MNKIDHTKINKIKNIIDETGRPRIYYSGETLPESYIPPQDYILMGIVVPVKKVKEKPAKIKGEELCQQDSVRSEE